MANLSVTYNGLTMCPTCDILTPFVSRSSKFEYEDGKARRLTTININGKITGDAYATVDYRRNLILNAFKKDFQPLTAGNYTFNKPKVDEVTFSDGSTGVIDFSISLTDYDAYFSDHGLHDVKNEWTIEEGEDGVINYKRTISAKGSRYSSASETFGDERDAVANAKAFCVGLAYPNVSAYDIAFFIDDADNDVTTDDNERGWTLPGGDSLRKAPWSTSHTYNRITGSYTIEETYKQGKWSFGGYVEDFDVSESHSSGEMRPTIDVTYSIETGMKTATHTAAEWINMIRGHMLTVDQIALKISNGLQATDLVFGSISNATYAATADGGVGDGAYIFAVLGDKPLSYEVTEYEEESKIEVSMTFDYWYRAPWTYTLPTSTVQPFNIILKNYYGDGNNFSYLDYEISQSKDEMSQITTVDVACTLKCARGVLSDRKAVLDAWYNADWTGKQYKLLYALANLEYEYETDGDQWQGTSIAAGTKLNVEVPYDVIAFPAGHRFELHAEPTILSEEYDPVTGETRFSATYNNRERAFTEKLDHDVYWANGNMFGINPWNHLTTVPRAQEWLPHKTFDWDMSQKVAMQQIIFKVGANGNMYDPDYLAFDLQNQSKEVTTVNITTDVAAGFFEWGGFDNSRAVLEYGIGRVVRGVALKYWSQDFLQAPLWSDYATNRVLENWDTNRASDHYPLIGGSENQASGPKLSASATWAQLPGVFGEVPQEGAVGLKARQGSQVKRGSFIGTPGNPGL